MTAKHTEPGPAELIERSGKTVLVLAAEGGVSISTVMAAKQTNRWPAQHRTRAGLRKALGLDQPAPVGADHG